MTITPGDPGTVAYAANPDAACDDAPTAVSWGAILAGAVAAVITTIILLVLGSGIGLTAISPWAGSGASAATVGVSAAIGLVVIQWISSGFGGFVAGRLRFRWRRVHADEVFFRDTAHGFLAWAVASLAGVVVFASVTASGISGAAKGAADIASAATSGATQAAGSELGGQGYFLDTLFRSTNGAQTDKADPRVETARILVRSTDNGQVTLSADDKAYLAQLVSAHTGLSPADAATRVDTVVGQINAASVKLREAADVARKRAAEVAILTALSMLIGAFIASAAGALGGTFRDEY